MILGAAIYLVITQPHSGLGWWLLALGILAGDLE